MTTGGGLIARAGCCQSVPVSPGSAIIRALAPMLANRTLDKRLAVVIAVLMVIFTVCFGGCVAAWRGSDQS